MERMKKMHAALMQAESKRRSGDLQTSEKICRSILQEDPIYLGALQTFGLVSIERQNFPQAVTCFLTAAAEAPDDWTNFLNLGVAWVGLEQHQMAGLMLREARRLHNGDTEVHRLLGEIALKQRDYDDAMSSLRQAIACDPNNKQAMAQLADCYTNLGYFDKAHEILTRLHRAQPDWLAVLGLLHQLPAEMTDIDFVEAVAKTKPQQFEPKDAFENGRRYLQAAILDRQGEHVQAWELLLQANAFVNKTTHTAHADIQERRNAELEVAKSAKIPPLDAKQSVSERAPLFIMGASRAGKTTLEITLSSHDQIQ
ncbi:MAG: tetratricopeptide repeat protein, partial [Pseudomonadota bacterium]